MVEWNTIEKNIVVQYTTDKPNRIEYLMFVVLVPLETGQLGRRVVAEVTRILDAFDQGFISIFYQGLFSPEFPHKYQIFLPKKDHISKEKM